MLQSIGTIWLWGGFIGFILAMLAIDIYGFGNNKRSRVTPAQALLWSIVWLLLTLIFNALLWWYTNNHFGIELAKQKALEFFTGYLIEKSLAIDNIFIFVMIFNYFAIPAIYQRRILMFGIIGAIVMRAVVILLGTFLLSKFHWLLYVFGILLIFTGIKILIVNNENTNLADSKLLKWLQQHLKIITDPASGKFFIYKNNRYYVTTLFLALILIEFSDIIFALDSVPAIFAITTDPFIVFTSNMFAILGLRALYFLLANMVEKFKMLKYAISIILIFVGSKIVIADWLKISATTALLTIASILILFIALDIRKNKNRPSPAN